MEETIRLTKRENQIAEFLAWGSTKKEIANKLYISVRTVENTARKVFEKTGITKVNELSAWWFCKSFNISMDLSPMKRSICSIAMILMLSLQIFNPDESAMRARRVRTGRKSKTEQYEPFTEL